MAAREQNKMRKQLYEAWEALGKAFPDQFVSEGEPVAFISAKYTTDAQAFVHRNMRLKQVRPAARRCPAPPHTTVQQCCSDTGGSLPLPATRWQWIGCCVLRDSHRHADSPRCFPLLHTPACDCACSARVLSIVVGNLPLPATGWLLIGCALQIVVAFRGSQTIEDWTTDGSFSMEPITADPVTGALRTPEDDGSLPDRGGVMRELRKLVPTQDASVHVGFYYSMRCAASWPLLCMLCSQCLRRAERKAQEEHTAS